MYFIFDQRARSCHTIKQYFAGESSQTLRYTEIVEGAITCGTPSQQLAMILML